MKPDKRSHARDRQNAERRERAGARAAREQYIAEREAQHQQALRDSKVQTPHTGLLAVCSKRVANTIREKQLEDVVKEMARYPQIRTVEGWKPTGKGKLAIFRSLAEHLFSKYKTPAFMWSVFQCQPGPTDKNYVVHAVLETARGESFYKQVKDGFIPAPLTRAMCHDLLTKTPADIPFIEAIRRVQMATAGSTKLLPQWMAHAIGNTLKLKTEEEFWYSVMGWLVRSGEMFDPEKVGPLLDFIQQKYYNDRSYSMKGRTLLAVLREMEEWHNNLQKIRKAKGEVFPRSGIMEFEEIDINKKPEETWRITELLSDKKLLDEGRALRHCVYSYSNRISRGDVSIWSMTWETMGAEERCLTLEVYNSRRAIIQARGYCNRMATPKEREIMNRWAVKNNLSLQC